MTDNELYERAIEAAYDAGRNRDGTPPDEWTLGKAIDVVDAYLAIAPQAPVSAVPVVKPLEWARENPYRTARTDFGHYSIELVDSSVTYFELKGSFTWPAKKFLRFDEAKSAAQADYEARILSALAAPPPPAQSDDAKEALIRELVAALAEFLEFGEYAYSHGREALANAKAAGFEP